ncbi:MAG: methyltransferase domain-containing protein [Candidatus Hydrogenedentes bacterium]|nr:methyltransferase domain-containing protein [Candidatus Hydrogenedentota bacterium]
MPRLDLLAGRGFSGTLLDVGCSVGTFLRAAKERGWKVQGLDLGEAACRRTAEALECPVHCGVLETVDLPDGAFDVIHASQVIEHVIEPQRFLAAARRLLRPGGALLLAAPIIDPKVYRTTHALQKAVVPAVSHGREFPYPWAIHHPFHVYAHSPKSLQLLTISAGFHVVHSRVVPWQSFARMNAKWRLFYHLMNALFRAMGTGMNMELLAIKED